MELQLRLLREHPKSPGTPAGLVLPDDQEQVLSFALGPGTQASLG